MRSMFTTIATNVSGDVGEAVSEELSATRFAFRVPATPWSLVACGLRTSGWKKWVQGSMKAISIRHVGVTPRFVKNTRVIGQANKSGPGFGSLSE